VAGKIYFGIIAFGHDFRDIAPLKLVGTLYCPALSLPQCKLLVSTPSSAVMASTGPTASEQLAKAKKPRIPCKY
jgi:hypothetical protein